MDRPSMSCFSMFFPDRFWGRHHSNACSTRSLRYSWELLNLEGFEACMYHSGICTIHFDIFWPLRNNKPPYIKMSVNLPWRPFWDSQDYRCFRHGDFDFIGDFCCVLTDQLWSWSLGGKLKHDFLQSQAWWPKHVVEHQKNGVYKLHKISYPQSQKSLILGPAAPEPSQPLAGKTSLMNRITDAGSRGNPRNLRDFGISQGVWNRLCLWGSL